MADPSNFRLKFRSDHLAAVAVTLAPLVYFLPALCNGLVLSPDDGILQNVPFRVVAAHIVRAGHLPLWDPYIFSGMPLLGAAQGGILFPLNWFYLVFTASTSSNLMVLVSFMTAALGAFLYARSTGTTLAGAAATSIVWQAGGFLINQISHINIVQTAALLPWVLWAVERYVTTGSRKRAALVALLIALQFFAGHQQAFAYSFLLTLAYALVMGAMDRDGRKRYLAAVGFVSVGLLLAAVQILPTWELLRNSVRATASYDFFTSFSMPKRFVLTFLAPYLMGGGDGRLFRAPYLGPSFYTEYVPYVGLISIVLALLALLLWRDRRTWFWTVVGVAGLLLAFGRYAPFSLNEATYFVPVLNLFRVPARHLMEVQFAVAVLTGRGLSRLASLREDKRVGRVAVAASMVVLVLTCVAVTVLRPAEFHLGRSAPVTILRAPELFMPIVIATLSALAIWLFVMQRKGASVLLFAVLIADLFLWGQFSGWYASSRRIPKEYWSVPESVKLLRQHAPPDASSYRILTTHMAFDPALSTTNTNAGWVLWTEPDIYLMHGIQNAAGYDGFGLQRYSELAGQMKLWGELTDPNATLRSESRELDILNVRYLVARRERPIPGQDGEVSEEELQAAQSAFAIASEKIGNHVFAKEDLSLPNIGPGKRLRFSVPAVSVDRVALLTNLSFGENVPDNAVVAKLRLQATDGRAFEFPLRAGADTADWAYDRPDLRARIRHRRATVATNYDVSDARFKYKGHTYLASFALPEKVVIESGELDLRPLSEWPGALLSVFRMSLADAGDGNSYPLSARMVTIETLSANGQPAQSERWKFVAHGLDVNIYENMRALPRAWLASEVRALDEDAILQVIRTGYLPDGLKWDPLRTALVETPLAINSSTQAGQVEVTTYEANRLRLHARASGESMLVLSENDYRGWRAYVDGAAVSIIRVNYGLRGVVIPAGEHEIVFVYRPWSVLGGAFISLAAAALLGVFCFVKRRVPAV
jgi:Bacterial membrane protein YfhO